MFERMTSSSSAIHFSCTPVSLSDTIGRVPSNQRLGGREDDRAVEREVEESGSVMVRGDMVSKTAPTPCTTVPVQHDTLWSIQSDGGERGKSLFPNRHGGIQTPLLEGLHVLQDNSTSTCMYT